MTTRDGRLPNLAKIASAVHAVGAPFSVRAIEAVVEGSLESTPAGPILRAARTGESFALGPMTKKVQWDSRTKKDQPIRARERDAYQRLAREAPAVVRVVRVVGRVVEMGPTRAPLLEVRKFETLPEGSRP